MTHQDTVDNRPILTSLFVKTKNMSWLSFLWGTNPGSPTEESKTRPNYAASPLPPKVSLLAFLQREDKAVETFIESLRQKGFCVFTLDAEGAEESIKGYFKTLAEFYSQKPEFKDSYRLRPRDNIIDRKVNYGYVLVEGVKEYFKKSQSDPVDSFPPEPKDFPGMWICYCLLLLTG